MVRGLDIYSFRKSNYSKINKPYYKKLNEINKHCNEKTKMRCLRCHQKIRDWSSNKSARREIRSEKQIAPRPTDRPTDRQTDRPTDGQSGL